MPRRRHPESSVDRGEVPAALLGLFHQLLGENQQVYNPEVDRTGDKIILPEGADLLEVIASLERRHAYEDQTTAIYVTIPVSPWDGALALQKAIEQELGIAIQKDGYGGATQIDIEVELGKTVAVPWGAFELPTMEGAYVSTDTALEDGRVVFQCTVECKRRYEPRVRRLLESVRTLATRESVHRGKAFSIAFHDENGRRIVMPKPRFFTFIEEEPIFRPPLAQAIERNVFVPIQHADSLIEMGQSLKRGVLFAGNYGVGKTLLASHIARKATAAGWTFIYVKNPAELPEALRFAQQYQPVVVFVEDIDRVAGLERTNNVNELLNQLDGIDGKAAKIMTIVTSNYPDRINEAMRRPGRIDIVLEVLPPDSETVSRMVQHFAKGSLDPLANLNAVSEVLDGETPARVRETVGRAKLESLRRTGDPRAPITTADLEAVAHEVKDEVSLFRRNANDQRDTKSAAVIADGFEHAAKVIRSGATNGTGQPLTTHA